MSKPQCQAPVCVYNCCNKQGACPSSASTLTFMKAIVISKSSLTRYGFTSPSVFLFCSSLRGQLLSSSLWSVVAKNFASKPSQHKNRTTKKRLRWESRLRKKCQLLQYIKRTSMSTTGRSVKIIRAWTRAVDLWALLWVPINRRRLG